MTAIAQFVEDEEHVAYIQCNATLQVIVEVDVTAQRFPVAVESSTDELSFAIDDGAAGVTAGDVVRREEWCRLPWRSVRSLSFESVLSAWRVPRIHGLRDSLFQGYRR